MKNTILVCDSCIKGIRSRGEEIFVGASFNIDEESEIKECYYCEQDYTGDVLYQTK